MCIFKKSPLRIFCLTAVVMAMLALTPLSVMAAESLDVNAAGSISVTISDSDGTAVAGGSLALYQVAETLADETEQPYYSLTKAFAGCDGDPNDMESVSKADLAETYQSYAEDNKVKTYATAQVGTDGTASFVNVPTGMYLVVQDEAAEGYYALSSFVVTVPTEEDGEYVYDVDATPKTEAVTAEEPKQEKGDEGQEKKPFNIRSASSPDTGVLGRTVIILLVAAAGALAVIICLLAVKKRSCKER
ncbi:MAG: hypothetical protein LUC41_03615 [Clostridiales bacterium]|nr:hypothetical protein [Clostridiales bacterium]